MNLTTNNASDMIVAQCICYSVKDLYIQCIAHEVNLGTKEDLQLVHQQLKNANI